MCIRDRCISIVELVYISITAKVSCKWKLVQAKVFRNQKAITDYAIVDSDDDEEEGDEHVVESTQQQDLESESSENLVAVEDVEVEQLSTKLDETILEELSDTPEETIIEKPTRKGKKKN